MAQVVMSIVCRAPYDRERDSSADYPPIRTNENARQAGRLVLLVLCFYYLTWAGTAELAAMALVDAITGIPFR